MERKKKYSKSFYIGCIYIGLVVFALCVVVVSLVRSYGGDRLLYWTSEYKQDWFRVYEDGSREKVILSEIKNLKKGDTLVVESTLPETIEPGTIIAMFDCRDMEVYIDGEARGHFSNKENPLPGANVKSIMFQTKLSSADGGKVIRYVKHETEGGKFGIAGIYYGDSLGIFRVVFGRYGLSFCLSALLFVISIIVAVVSCFMIEKYDEWKSILALGVGFFFVTAWMMADSSLMQYVFGVTYVDGVWAYMFSMLIPCPFLYFINVQQKRRYEKSNHLVCLMIILNFVVNTVLHFSGVTNYQETKLFMNIVIAASVLYVIVTLWIDIWKGHAQEYHNILVGMLGFGIGGILEVVLINIMDNRLNGVYMLAGLYILLAANILHIFSQVRSTRAAAMEAIQANHMKSDFLASMSHEIRTPINAIVGMNELILREYVNPEIREYSENIKIASNNLLELVNKILDLSKIEAGKMELVEQGYELSALLKELDLLIGVKAKQKGLQLQIDFDQTLPNKLYGDKDKIKHILLNLLNNAVKYTEKGKVTLALSGEIQAEVLLLKARVTDTGIGIKEEDREKIFEKFSRVDLKTNAGIEGTGLGLAITAGLLKILDGTITVQSVYGEGSEFEVYVSQKIVGTETINEALKENSAVAKENKTKIDVCVPDAKVLVVDDTDMNLKVFVGLLKKTQIRISTASSGKECLESVKKEHFDLIFLDHMMPEMDGMETLKRLQETEHLCKETPVIALTANAINGARENYLAAGFKDYLSKPIVLDELMELLAKYLA